ncbi:MAG: type II toxin-antitoxin system VapC family toxin [Acidobacteria bacterium]|nr:type II toxin-antitoxin system VapC family toxin [Acidobacteriota bacterium]
MADVVVDASALVDLLLGNRLGKAVARRLVDERLHAPAHIDSEVLSALGRMHRGGLLTVGQVDGMLRSLTAAPIARHGTDGLVAGAWARRDRVRLVDALYLELAERVGGPLITTDLRLRHEPRVEALER